MICYTYSYEVAKTSKYKIREEWNTDEDEKVIPWVFNTKVKKHN